MDYEKKYKETLEKARQLCAYPTSKPFISDLQDLFPELKESEDERTRKEIVRFIRMEVEDEIVGNKWIAWLEKQGEQKPADIRTTGYWNVQEVEQKPAWSEEDEKIVSEVIQNYESGFLPSVIERDRIAKTLKSLKNRVLPQPKQEWSKEDKRIYMSIIYSFEHNYPLTVQQQEFVKSLRPQTWEPSDEQLKSLQEVIDVGHFTSYPNSLETLYEQLKKLKGE